MFRVILCDGDGTLENEGAYYLKLLRRRGFQVGVVSGQVEEDGFFIQRFRDFNLSPPDIIVTRRHVNRPKGSGALVQYAANRLAVDPHEILLLGDTRYDVFEAMNGQAFPAVARYTRASTLEDPVVGRYGFQVYTPLSLFHYLDTFGRMSPPFFGWECELPDGDVIYALRFEHDTRIQRLLKEGQDTLIRRVDLQKRVLLSQLLFHDLAAAIFHSNIRPDIMALYPGHRARSFNEILDSFQRELKRMFRAFTPQLLVRTRDVPSLRSIPGAERRNNFARLWGQQIRSLQVNRDSASLSNKRVLVLDDFTTTGISLEAARHLLHQHGVAQVIGLAIGKFRRAYHYYQGGGFHECQGRSFSKADKRFGEYLEYYKNPPLPEQ